MSFPYIARVHVELAVSPVNSDKHQYFELRYFEELDNSNFTHIHVSQGSCLFDLILYVPSTIFQLSWDGSSWVEPVLS